MFCVWFFIEPFQGSVGGRRIADPTQSILNDDRRPKSSIEKFGRFETLNRIEFGRGNIYMNMRVMTFSTVKDFAAPAVIARLYPF